MAQEMTRRGYKGIGGIHRDEMAIKEGIVLCKWTEELVGFEDFNISPELTTEPESLNENDEDDSDSSSESSDSQFSSASEQEYDSSSEAPLLDVKESQSSKKSHTCLSVLFFIIRRGLF